jgi:uncharacterized protein (TIGR00297 family)
LTLIRLFLGLLLSGLVSLVGYQRGALALSGVFGAVAIGTCIVGFGGWAWGSLLVAFFVSSSLLSLYRWRDKIALTDKFAKGSRRDLGQTLANGGLGALMAVGYSIVPGPTWLAAFIGAMATVTSDTWATEAGVLSRQTPRLITTWREVARGTSGGVTRDGSLAALAGGLYIGLCAILFLKAEQLALGQSIPLDRLWPILPMGGISGLAGALVDSLLGAKAQGMYYCDVCCKETEQSLHRCGCVARHLRGWQWLNNDLVNLASSAIGALVAVVLTGWLL